MMDRKLRRRSRVTHLNAIPDAWCALGCPDGFNVPPRVRVSSGVDDSAAQILGTTPRIPELEDLGVSGEQHESMRCGRRHRKAVTKRDRRSGLQTRGFEDVAGVVAKAVRARSRCGCGSWFGAPALSAVRARCPSCAEVARWPPSVRPLRHAGQPGGRPACAGPPALGGTAGRAGHVPPPCGPTGS